MKKITLLALMLSASIVSAQQLQTENFTTVALGNISPLFDGAAAGNGGLYLFAENGAAPTTTTNASANNGTIVNVAGNRMLALIGPNGDKGGTYVWKDGLPAAWTSRTTGNNIVEIEVDYNPGVRGGLSTNRFGVSLYNAAFDRTLVGFGVNNSTGELFIVAYSTPTGQPVGNYNYSLAAAPGIQIPENVVSRIGISYNFTTGQVRIKAPGIAAPGITVAGSSPNTPPAEVDFVAFSGHTPTLPNAAASTGNFDNLVVRASATDTLLSLNSDLLNNSFSISPNPTTDFINIKSDNNINISSVNIVDINGRIIKEIAASNVSNLQINMSDLAAGMYIMNIKSDQGTATKKIIKK